jgi:hypothetical protein
MSDGEMHDASPTSSGENRAYWSVMKWRVAMYALWTLLIAGLLWVSDSVRPPYISWRFELALSATGVSMIALMRWWERR